MCNAAAMEQTRYELSAYGADGERLSLSASNADPDTLSAQTIWEAASMLAQVPAQGWMHWIDGESELMPITRVVLRHVQVTLYRGRQPKIQINTLEVITR